MTLMHEQNNDQGTAWNVLAKVVHVVVTLLPNRKERQGSRMAHHGHRCYSLNASQFSEKTKRTLNTQYMTSRFNNQYVLNDVSMLPPMYPVSTMHENTRCLKCKNSGQNIILVQKYQVFN